MIVKDEFRPVPPGGVLVLGQDQDSPGGDFDKNQAFSGEITQVPYLSQNELLSPQQISWVF